jgi:hypothetical protein
MLVFVLTIIAIDLAKFAATTPILEKHLIEYNIVGGEDASMVLPFIL